MLSIFRRKKNDEIKKEGNDQSFSTEELINEKEETTETEIETALSFHPSWNLPAEQQYVFRFLNNELEPLKPNQISLSGIEVGEGSGGIEVTAFVRNSLQKAIQLEEATLLLLDKESQVIARHKFDLSELGEIPGKSSRPWVFVFPQESLKVTEFSKENWTLAFELRKKHSLDLEESWQKGLSEDAKKQLENIVNSTEPPKEGEINIMGLQAKLDDEGSLHTTIFIRNGTDKDIQIEQLPLQVIDASGEVAAQGGFTLNDFEVKANTSKPWTFIFPKDNIKKDQPDLSKWIIKINQ
ncbi:accessory Sec system S-layer assembly protein [Cytobacillus depressus]|uniref:Accessory Sec system S-layer assembly protein n=1 Tax=Cytobacillus depressus TaxID=1602942 RepID=A0A6L3V697_9BACI|nr:accessory Sec system S-layer assembly protein [Cytobacillus depressus]KAB2336769.1 accessory Sec system S-layer assembly protein [Cytobacillus depressus]